jgi:lipoprotein Spr
MKKIILSILIFVLTIANVKAQSSLPIQYLELAKKIANNIGKTTSSALIPKEKSTENITTSSDHILDFAKTLLGIPYHYATSNPKIGFDCSGFVNYVFSNFGFKMPRSSPEFSAVGKETNMEDAKVGDILIFTGTNPKVRRVGHVGIVYAVGEDGVQFIHATSGKAHGVTITELNDYYKSRFMKIVRVL